MVLAAARGHATEDLEPVEVDDRELLAVPAHDVRALLQRSRARCQRLARPGAPVLGREALALTAGVVFAAASCNA
jgi:hypothetical protein